MAQAAECNEEGPVPSVLSLQPFALCCPGHLYSGLTGSWLCIGRQGEQDPEKHASHRRGIAESSRRWAGPPSIPGWRSCWDSVSVEWAMRWEENAFDHKIPTDPEWLFGQYFLRIIWVDKPWSHLMPVIFIVKFLCPSGPLPVQGRQWQKMQCLFIFAGWRRLQSAFPSRFYCSYHPDF